METEKKAPTETTGRFISLQTKLLIGFLGLSALVSFLTARGIYTNMQNVLTDDVRAKFVTQSTYVFFFAVGLGIAFGLVAGKVITDSILKLSAGAKALAAGELSERIELDTHDEITDLAKTFNTMASEIQGLINSLEQRVAERTTDLENRTKELESANENIKRRASQFEALAQVSQSISSVHDLQELLPHITSVVSEKYNFYHVGIFLLDEPNEYAVLTAANSVGGKKMLERQHRLKVGEQGIVGSVTSTGEPRIALDVGKDAVFFTNKDLPDTHSEMALPLRSGNKIIGALDVQSTETGAFSSEDVQTLSLLASQVSLAIENARLFEEENTTLEELQTISRQSTRDAWKRLPQKQKLLGYRYNAMGSTPLKEFVKLAESDKGKTKAKGAEAGPFVVPIELRGEIIGNLLVQSSTGKEWNSDEQDIIKAVAERVALSAENARLFEETNQRAERERLVSDITSKIRSHNNPQAMIETAVNELRNALGASRVEVIPQKTTDGIEEKE
ncbi:MAG: GAF domain-containing protein [Anaerolineales bacterium]|nr:GAF domain-containing protein [Anaerolineales bacterium]